jgi:hypothetical protein
VLLGYRAHHNSRHSRSPFFLTHGLQLRLLGEHPFDVLQRTPTDAEIGEVQYKRQEHIQNLEQHRDDANSRALKRLWDLADQRENSYHERALGIGDLVLRRSEAPSKLHPHWDGPFIIHDLAANNTYQLSTRNGYILRHLYNSTRLRPYHSSNANPVLWYASANLQRKDAHTRRAQRSNATHF